MLPYRRTKRYKKKDRFILTFLSMPSGRQTSKKILIGDVGSKFT